MNIAALISDLRSDEGWRPAPYRDSERFLTIGYGFLIDERKAVAMPLAVGDLWLELAAKDKVNALQARLPWLSAQPDSVQRALGNMAYQMGVDGVAGFTEMLKALVSGDRAMAAVAALDSKWAKQTPERAQRVTQLIRGQA